MTKSQAPSASTYVSNLINEILENKGWKGFHSQDVPGCYSNGTKFTFEKSWYKWRKNNKIVSYYCCNVWKINSHDDIIITDCKFDNSINIWPEFFGFFLCDFEYKINPPTKKINYLMNRVDNNGCSGGGCGGCGGCGGTSSPTNIITTRTNNNHLLCLPG